MTDGADTGADPAALELRRGSDPEDTAVYRGTDRVGRVLRERRPDDPLELRYRAVTVENTVLGVYDDERAAAAALAADWLARPSRRRLRRRDG